MNIKNRAPRIVEYVWMEGELLAQVDSSGNIVYVHNSHLGAPMKITNPSRTIVWDQISEPFGEVYSTPTSTTPTTHRFPGQIYDSENGLYYNNFRDYDPTLGFYAQIDPLGQRGGLNQYAYSSQSPLERVDPLGLDDIKIGFEHLQPGTVQNGAQNVGRDTGHTYIQYLDSQGNVISQVSMGPIGSVNKTAYMSTGQPATTDYKIKGETNEYILHVDDANIKQCKQAFENKKENPGPFNKDNNCTTTVVEIGGACVSNMPNGLGPVTYPPVVNTPIQVVNPNTLEDQIRKISSPPSGSDQKK